MVLRKPRRRDRGAFTLMEMLVVVTIIVMLAAFSTVGYFRYLEQAREQTAKAQISNIDKAVTGYKLAEGEYPESLQLLIVPSEGKAAYLESKDLLDPWGHPYLYEAANLNPNTFKPKISSDHNTGGATISNW
jgi:general secretion pathway protein G